MESGGYLASEWSHREDGYRIVGCTDIREDHQGGNTHLCSSLAGNMTGQTLGEKGYATTSVHAFYQSASQHGDDDELAHTHHAIVDGMKPTEQVKTPESHAHKTRHQCARSKNEHHIHATEGCKEYIYIRYDEQSVGLQYAFGSDVHRLVLPYQEIKHKTDKGCGDGYTNITAKLISQLTALCLGGHDGGIGDKTKIVTEESTSYHYGYCERKRKTCLVSHSSCYGRKGCNGAHTGTHTQGDKARGQEDATKYHAGWQETDGHADGGIDGACLFGCRCKCSRQNEYPYHGHQTRTTGTICQHLETLPHTLTRHGEERETTSYEKCYDNGHSVEVPSKQTEDKVREEKHQQRAE